MKTNTNIIFENEEMKSTIDEEIVILRLKSNAFYNLFSIDKSNEIINWFAAVSEMPDIKAVCILNETGSLGNASYDVYVEAMKSKKSETGKSEYSWEAKKKRLIEINMINNFIKAVLNSPKIVVTGMCGTVVTTFVGAGLAADFRFINESTHFSLSHTKYSLHAAGALPFFLPKFIGHGKAMEFLLSGGEISAKQSLELGLVTDILPENDFFNSVIQRTKQYATMDPGFVKRTKSLLADYRKAFSDFIVREGDIIEHY